MAKYHVNDEGVAGVCRATKRPCKFGGEDGKANHYETKEEAQVAADKKLKRKYANIMTSMKKAKVPTTLTPDSDLEDVDSETRANVMIFEAMKRYATIGEVDDNNYYGSPRSIVYEDTEKKLIAMGAVKPENNYDRYGNKRNLIVRVADLEDNGYRVEFIPGTLDSGYTDHFDDTFSPSMEKPHMTAKAVVYAPNGAKAEVPVFADEDIMDLTTEAVNIAAQRKQTRAHTDLLMQGQRSMREEMEETKRENQRLQEELHRMRQESAYESDDQDVSDPYDLIYMDSEEGF